MELVTGFTVFLTFERTFAIFSASIWLVSAGELEAGVEYVGIATHIPAIEVWPAGHPVTGDMFPPRYGIGGGLGVDVFGVAAGAGVLTLTARANFEGLIETDGPKEVVRLI